MRSHTRGYTGPKWQNQREGFIYLEENIKIANEQIVDIIKKDLKTDDPLVFTQFVRCHLFVLVDCNLTSNFEMKKENRLKIDKNEIDSIIGLCDNYIGLYCKWLSLLPKYFNSVIYQLKDL